MNHSAAIRANDIQTSSAAHELPALSVREPVSFSSLKDLQLDFRSDAATLNKLLAALTALNPPLSA